MVGYVSLLRAFLPVLRFAFVLAVAFSVISYVPAAQRVPWPRFAEPVDPFTRELPLSLRGIEVTDGMLVVKVYRSYSIPLARKVVVNVTACGDTCEFFLFSERIPPGSVREFMVYIRGRLCEVYVSLSLEGSCVGFWAHTFGCGEG